MSSTTRTLCVVGLLAVLTCAVATAQRGGGGMGGHGMGMPGGGGGNHGGHPLERGEGRSMRGGTQLGPPGRWWDDKKVANTLGLNKDQQKRMDSVFSQNRDALQSSFSNLQKSESKLDDLKNSKHPSEAALSTQIDQVAQARADLEKNYTHMLLQIRGEMTPDQLTKLEDVH